MSDIAQAKTIAHEGDTPAHSDAGPRFILCTLERANRPKLTRHALSWPRLAAEFTKGHAERADKDGRGFVLADFHELHRNAANVASYSGLVLDLDTHTDEAGEIHAPPPPEDAAQALRSAGLAGIVYSTHNHNAPPEANNGKPSGPRYRVVLPLAQPLPPEGLEDATRRAAALLGLHGPALDAKSWSRGQFFYAPSCPPGAARFAEAMAGRLLTVEDLAGIEVPSDGPEAANDNAEPRAAGQPAPSPIPRGAAQRGNFDDTKARARGQWRGILSALGIAVPDTPKAHAPCPGCGGRDRFRFDDRDGDGNWLCSQGGAGTVSGDGFNLVRHVRGCTEAEALRLVREALGLSTRADRTREATERGTERPNDRTTERRPDTETEQTERQPNEGAHAGQPLAVVLAAVEAAEAGDPGPIFSPVVLEALRRLMTDSRSEWERLRARMKATAPGVRLGELEKLAQAIKPQAEPQASPAPLRDELRDEERRRRQKEQNEALQLPAGESILPPIMSPDDMLARLVWVAQGEQVADLEDRGRFLTWKEFRSLTAASLTFEEPEREGGKPRPIPNAVLWQRDPARKTVMTRTFRPGAGIVCHDPDGLLAVNTWRPIDRRPAPVPALFLEHLEYLIPDALERGAFLDWLAHLEQRPGELPHYGWLHVAANTGTGRNWLASVLARVWRGYVAPNVDLPELLDSPYNGKLAGRVLAIVDEVQEGAASDNPYRHANRLKSLVNAEHRDINPKFGRQYREHNACRWLVFSNHLNAIPINDTDRRWRVVQHTAAPRPAEDYVRLYRALEDAEFINGVAWYLARRDVSAFNPGERPPMSDAKRAVIGASKTIIQESAEGLVAHWPADVIANRDAALVLSDGVATEVTPAMRRALMELGCVKWSGVVKVRGTPTRCWVLRNPEKWSATESAFIAREIQRARADYATDPPALEVLANAAR